MSKDFFAYGTLMCEDIMLAVTGSRFKHIPGYLRDYRRRAVKNEVYPGLIPEQGGSVEGIVYFDLTDAVFAVLDRFEDEMYQRQIVQITLEDRTSIAAQTYVVKPEFGSRLDPREWDFEKFVQSGKENFERQYAGFKAVRKGR